VTIKSKKISKAAILSVKRGQGGKVICTVPHEPKCPYSLNFVKIAVLQAHNALHSEHVNQIFLMKRFVVKRRGPSIDPWGTLVILLRSGLGKPLDSIHFSTA